MIRKLIVAVICVAFAAGFESNGGFYQTQTTDKVSQKQRSFTPKQELLVPSMKDTTAQVSALDNHVAGNNQQSTGYYQPTANIHQSEGSRTDFIEPITRHNQPKSDQHQQITDQHGPTSERVQPTGANYRTMGYLPKTPDHTMGYLHKTPDQPRTGSSTGKYNQATGKDTAVTQLFQSWSRASSPQPSSSEHPQKAEATKSPFPVDYLIPGVFLCGDGKFIINSTSVCDGQIDCPDSSDELPDMCMTSQTTKTTRKTRKCRSNEFQCPSGKCVPYDRINFSDSKCWEDNSQDENNLSKSCQFPNLLCDNNTKCVSAGDRCNGLSDCLDQTDEMISPFTFVTSDLRVMCANGNCVSPKVLCNDYNDCGDNSDETSCDDDSITKQPFLDQTCTEYICTSGQCILNNQVCDGDNDCGDNSDESACDESVWFWSNNKGLIISVSVLGAAVLITIVAVISVTIHYKRKYKNLTQEHNRMDNHPPPYWQVVGVSGLGPIEKTDLKTANQVNVPYGGTTAFPE